jgi:hypothetical protein
VRLSRTEHAILSAMSRGALLRSHRELDGQKMFCLHLADGGEEPADAHDVHRLREVGLIDSNKKFPVATFWLTSKGKLQAGQNDES